MRPSWPSPVISDASALHHGAWDLTRAVGLDSGTSRVGLAFGDDESAVALPVATLRRRDGVDFWRRLESEIRERGAEVVVVGLPRRLDGSEGEAAAAARGFAAEVARRFGLPVEFQDEWLTTAQAERSLLAAGLRRNRRRDSVDAVAAGLMLQGWLDARRLGRAR